MSYLNTFFVLVFIIPSSFASGTYRYQSKSHRGTYRPPALPTIPRSNQTAQPESYQKPLGPRVLSQKSLFSKLDKLRKKIRHGQISINNLNSTEQSFEFTGSFANRSVFDEFLKNVKDSLVNPDEVKLTLKRNVFAGRVSYDFRIYGVNAWK